VPTARTVNARRVTPLVWALPANRIHPASIPTCQFGRSHLGPTPTWRDGSVSRRPSRRPLRRGALPLCDDDERSGCGTV
jgi:hypothetical protein